MGGPVVQMENTNPNAILAAAFKKIAEHRS
jgi:hypothetical protein